MEFRKLTFLWTQDSFDPIASRETSPTRDRCGCCVSQEHGEKDCDRER